MQCVQVKKITPFFFLNENNAFFTISRKMVHFYYTFSTVFTLSFVICHLIKWVFDEKNDLVGKNDIKKKKKTSKLRMMKRE